MVLEKLAMFMQRRKFPHKEWKRDERISVNEEVSVPRKERNTGFVSVSADRNVAKVMEGWDEMREECEIQLGTFFSLAFPLPSKKRIRSSLRFSKHPRKREMLAEVTFQCLNGAILSILTGIEFFLSFSFCKSGWGGWGGGVEMLPVSMTEEGENEGCIWIMQVSTAIPHLHMWLIAPTLTCIEEIHPTFATTMYRFHKFQSL